MAEFSKLQAGITALSTGSGPLTFDAEVIQRLFDDPNPSVQMSDILSAASVHSLRQQVEFKVQPGRMEIRDMSEVSPYRQEFPDICARVTQWMTEQKVEWRSHGWNFALTSKIGETSAGQLVIGLLNKSPRLPNDLTGAALTLNYGFQGARVTLKLEPRSGMFDKPEVFASANYHFEDSPPQTSEEIRGISGQLWDDFLGAVGRLIEKGN